MLIIVYPGSYGQSGILKDLVRRSLMIKSIDAEIEQHIKREAYPVELFKGRYRADNKGRFRIDFDFPDHQIVLNNGGAIFWYYPDDKLLYNLGEAVPSSKGLSSSPMMDFTKELERDFIIEYSGKHVYGLFFFAHKFELKNKKNGLKMLIWIDTDENNVLEKCVLDRNGNEIIKELYGNYKNINGHKFPTRIDVFAKTGTGVTRNTTFYKNVRLNRSIPEGVFNIKFPEDVEERYLKNSN